MIESSLFFFPLFYYGRFSGSIVGIYFFFFFVSSISFLFLLLSLSIPFCTLKIIPLSLVFLLSPSSRSCFRFQMNDAVLTSDTCRLIKS